jgi:hypothetical protein
MYIFPAPIESMDDETVNSSNLKIRIDLADVKCGLSVYWRHFYSKYSMIKFRI